MMVEEKGEKWKERFPPSHLVFDPHPPIDRYTVLALRPLFGVKICSTAGKSAGRDWVSKPQRPAALAQLLER